MTRPSDAAVLGAGALAVAAVALAAAALLTLGARCLAATGAMEDLAAGGPANGPVRILALDESGAS